MPAYYNENDPDAAEWLRHLIDGSHIPTGDVDERSIEDVKPEDLDGYTQCHFFAGIGGWPYALRLAGWSDNRPVWTGSPPCQPFSSAGQRGGYDDSRHLAPAWLDLVKECRPSVLFGEQVASAASSTKHPWIDDLQDALEAEDYATGAVVLPACGVGAPHIRQRIFFVAQRVANSERRGSNTTEPVAGKDTAIFGGQSKSTDSTSSGDGRSYKDYSLWSEVDWVHCRDEKWRPVEPGAVPLVDGVPARVGRLRGYGNAIVPQVAAEVIAAYMDAE